MRPITASNDEPSILYKLLKDYDVLLKQYEKKKSFIINRRVSKLKWGTFLFVCKGV
jgi:hypothetical protein